MIKKLLKDFSLPETYISVTLGFLVVVVAGLLIYNNFNKNSTGNVTGNETAQEVLVDEKGNKLTPPPTTHTVAEGENLWTIAEKYYGSGYNWVTIAKENNLLDPDGIAVGQKLELPKAEKIALPSENISASATSRSTEHTVVRGENLWTIAVSEYGDGFMWTKIAQANNLVNPSVIHAGNVLRLPRE